MGVKARKRMKHQIITIGLAAVLSLCSAARAAETKAAEIMPFAQQNAVVKKQCASCHSDALMYGGLSLEHFDAAHSDPTLAAMLISKITNGYSPKEVNAASGPEANAKILGMVKTGAMTAGGPLPDEATQLALARALSAEAAGSEEWHSVWEESPAQPRTLTATILRQLPSTKFPEGRIDMYRLILSCRITTHEGEIKLAWANGVPEEGREISVAVDGKAPFIHKVEGGKKQGNGVNGPGATILYPDPGANMPLPAKSLVISNLFPDERVEFPLDRLDHAVRRDLSLCFGTEATTY
jgi:hypothetical protein